MRVAFFTVYFFLDPKILINLVKFVKNPFQDKEDCLSVNSLECFF